MASHISIPIPPETEDAIRDMLEGIARDVIQKAAASEAGSRDFLSIKEAADYLGVAINTLKCWMKFEDHPLPVIRLNGRVFISKKSLIHWMHEQEATN